MANRDEDEDQKRAERERGGGEGGGERVDELFLRFCTRESDIINVAESLYGEEHGHLELQMHSPPKRL